MTNKMVKPVRCDCCGRFRKRGEVLQMEAEEKDGVWMECKDCMNGADLERFFGVKNNKEPGSNEKNKERGMSLRSKRAREALEAVK